MKDLRLPMNELNFEQLVERGRSAIPTLAPGWTDHNVHDPGIMLVELMAWIADAQIYSLSRMRRDERRAYARLLGVEARGPSPAAGLVWPLAGTGSKDAPPMTWSAGAVVEAGRSLVGDRPQAPKFFTTRAVALTTAQLVKIETRFADGSSHDWTRANGQDGATFLPFGVAPAPGDRLVLQFTGALNPSPEDGTQVSIGVEIMNADRPLSPGIERAPARLQVSLTDSAGEHPLQLVEDTTGGLLESGVLLLRVGENATSQDGTFTISISSLSGGFLRSPRVRRIAANVLPVAQMEAKTDNKGAIGTGLPDQQYTLDSEGLVYLVKGAIGTGLPDQQCTLDNEGLVYTVPSVAFTVKFSENDGWLEWSRVEDLQASGPEDRHFELDVSKRVLSFGNGVNGRVPPPDAAIQVAYGVSKGSRGNLPEGVGWTLQRLAGAFGVNSQAMTGGEEPQSLEDLRADARGRLRTSHPLVTRDDLEKAAGSFRDLGVTRATELAAETGCPRVRGRRALMVVGPHDEDAASAALSVTEPPDFLEEVRSRLAPQLPLGQGLEVIGPRYVALRISATLVAAANTDPKAVNAKVAETLRARFAIVPAAGTSTWPFGRDVTRTAVKGWLRNVEGVARVIDVRFLVGARAEPKTTMTLGAMELPQLLRPEPGDISVQRPQQESAR